MGPTEFVGSLGQAMIFLFTLAALGIAGPLWLCYASHCFLVLITESSIGEAEVRWPDETVTDWWWKALYCFGMLAFWATACLTLFSPLLLVSPWLFGVAAGVLVWFAFPIGMLCVMDADSALAIVHLPLIIRLVRHAGAVLLVGITTLPLGVMTVGLLTGAVLHNLAWAIGAAFVLPVTLLLYGRSWGRLAWLVLNVKRRRPPKEAPPREAAEAVAHDPWAPPPRQEAPAPPPIETLEPELPAPPPPDPIDDEWGMNPAPYGVPVTQDSVAPFSHDDYYRQYRKREEERKARAEGRKPGEKRARASLRTAFGRDFWPFLFEHRTQRVALSLGVLTLLVLAMVRILVAMMPGV
jgi:hypothetical protein